MITRRVLLTTLAAAAGLCALPALAQSGFPNKPVTLVVPFPPGGPIDVTGRALAARLQEIWKQPVVVENKSGANGAIGAAFVSRAAPDGYTLLVNSIHHSVLPSLMPSLGYDPKDLLPVSYAATFDIFLVAHPSAPFNSVSELIAYAKKNPGKVSYASAGSGGGTHMAGELFRLQTGTQLLQIPYKGSAPAVTDVLGGQVNMMFADGPSGVPHAKRGALKALAVGSPKRSSALPDVPTFNEAGLKGYEAYSWAGVMAPAGTPKALIDKISADVNTALNHPDARARLAGVGATAAPNTPEQYGKFFQAEMAKWAKVIKDGNIKVD